MLYLYFDVSSLNIFTSFVSSSKNKNRFIYFYNEIEKVSKHENKSCLLSIISFWLLFSQYFYFYFISSLSPKKFYMFDFYFINFTSTHVRYQQQMYSQQFYISHPDYFPLKIITNIVFVIILLCISHPDYFPLKMISYFCISSNSFMCFTYWLLPLKMISYFYISSNSFIIIVFYSYIYLFISSSPNIFISLLSVFILISLPPFLW